MDFNQPDHQVSIDEHMEPSPVIRFSHKYEKLNVLNGKKRAMLLEVIKVNIGSLSSPFILYDTDRGLYPLPKSGRFLLLIFQGEGGLFTTLRSAKPGKEDYYRGNIGRMFRVTIEPS